MARKKRGGSVTPPTINPEFRALCAPLSGEERAQLRENLKAEGCRDPLVVWEAFLLDGHNRLELCDELEIPYKTVKAPKWVREAKDALDWIARNQLGRRNITGKQASYLRGKLYLSRKRQGERTDLASGQNGKKSTAEALAGSEGISPRTVVRDAAFARAVDGIVSNCGEASRSQLLARGSCLSRKDVHELAELDAVTQRDLVSKLLQGEIFRAAMDVALGRVDPETGEPLEGLREPEVKSSPDPALLKGGGPAPCPPNGAPPTPKPGPEPEPPREGLELLEEDPAPELGQFRYFSLERSLDPSEEFLGRWIEPLEGDRVKLAMNNLRTHEHVMGVHAFHSRLLVYLLKAWTEARFQAATQIEDETLTPEAIESAKQAERLVRGAIERVRRVASWELEAWLERHEETYMQCLEAQGVIE